VYYTNRISFITKLFLLIALLAYPVPKPGIDPAVWAYAIANTLTIGSFFSILTVWIVYALFPDKSGPATEKKSDSAGTGNGPGVKERFNRALEILIITFPVVIAFIFFQWGNALLVLIYIVVLSMLPGSGHAAGKVKILGNIIGGAATIIFYNLIVIVNEFLFFILLFLGTILFFAGKIFSDRPEATLYKTGFSALVIIIGGVTTSTGTAGSEIWMRILQVMTAVFYVVGASAVLEAVKIRKMKKRGLNGSLV
jgi:energy-converting hydrogenase Eha subunit E